MPRGIHNNKVGSKPFDAHQMPHVSRNNFPKMLIRLIDGRVMPVLQATPQEFDRFVALIIRQISAPKTKRDWFEELDRTRWNAEERWYILDEIAASPLIKKQGIELFAESECVR